MLGNNQNIEKKCFIWNAIASVINASEAVIILMIITRTKGIVDAGIITIAFSIANLMLTIGKFGVRNLQVTDIKEEYKFSTYFSFRILTTILMFIFVCGYLLYCVYLRGYSCEKIIIIFLICLIFVFESIEDVFIGYYQQKKRLDVGAKVFSVRWIITIIVYAIGTILLKNLIGIVFLTCLISIVCMITLLSITSPFFIVKPIRFNTIESGRLFRNTFPLFLSSFLSFYIINAPKYAIDAYLPEEVAYYGFISMPIFVIGILNGFIYQPSLVKITMEWKEGNTNKFIKRIVKQIVIIILLTGCCIGGANVIGVPTLSIIFGTDLYIYKKELLILLLGGGMFAAVGYLGTVLTIIRHQKDLIFLYILTAFLAKIFVKVFVKTGGILGAAIFYTGLVSMLAITLGILVFYRILRENKDSKVN